MRMADVDNLTEDDVRVIMLEMPFRKFEQRKYFAYDKSDLSYIRIQSSLWRQLRDENISAIKESCARRISQYYERLAK